MGYGQSVVMVGNEWSDDHRSPASIGGKNTQSVHVQLGAGEDIDAHCDRARGAGAAIIAEPETQFYGDRTYRAKDPEGHIWTFGVTVEAKTAAEIGRESCRERVCQLRVDLGGRGIIKKKKIKDIHIPKNKQNK